MERYLLRESSRHHFAHTEPGALWAPDSSLGSLYALLIELNPDEYEGVTVCPPGDAFLGVLAALVPGERSRSRWILS